MIAALDRARYTTNIQCVPHPQHISGMIFQEARNPFTELLKPLRVQGFLEC